MESIWLPLSERLSEGEGRRVLAKVRVIGSCWHYTGSTDEGGYARIWYRGQNWHGTRLIVWVVRGMVVPAGCDVAHECHNPACINPAHLAIRHKLTNRRTRIAAEFRLRPSGDGRNWKVARELKAQRRFLREVYLHG
jgi:hypothetical protein